MPRNLAILFWAGLTVFSAFVGWLGYNVGYDLAGRPPYQIIINLLPPKP